MRAWPTLAVIDPEGYVVAQHSGEGHAHALDKLFSELVAQHSLKGTLHRGDGPYVAPSPQNLTFHFPAKAISLEDSVLVADAGYHRIVEVEKDLSTVRRLFGVGVRGFDDGDHPRFSEPNGLCLLPEEIARKVGYDVVVADTVNHALRGIDLASGSVRTIAGTGEQWMQGDGPGYVSARALETRLSSPWDVVWFPAIEKIVIAMAGIHQLWAFDPVEKTVEVLAGTTNEGMVDGDAPNAWFAQTSGLAVSSDGQTLWIADSETSSLRRLTNGVVHTEIGKGLFDFGFVDGEANSALLQHPLGVAVLPDDTIVIADTYNKAVRHFNSSTKIVSTIMQGMAEPSGFAFIKKENGIDLVVVESAAHQLTRITLADKHQVNGDVHKTKRPATVIATGESRVRVVFTPPTGQKLDDRFGPATHLVVSSSPPELLIHGAGAGAELERDIIIKDVRSAGVTDAVLHVSVRAASCDIAEDNEFPACHIHQQDWGVPVTLSDDGAREIVLLLAGI